MPKRENIISNKTPSKTLMRFQKLEQNIIKRIHQLENFTAQDRNEVIQLKKTRSDIIFMYDALIMTLEDKYAGFTKDLQKKIDEIAKKRIQAVEQAKRSTNESKPSKS